MNRIALIGIIVEDTGKSAEINNLLHEYGKYIIGRMGVPHRERKLSIISVMLDAPGDVINSLSSHLRYFFFSRSFITLALALAISLISLPVR